MLKGYPRQIKFIVGNEAAERYSYYGMKSILVIFMTQSLLMAKESAISDYHLFSAACYLLPLLGAFLSDRYLGKYKTIMSLSLVYCLGHFILALYETQLGMYWGLGLIALGSGGIKPCVSAHVGDQFGRNEEGKLRKIFDLFYWMINFGSFFATIITPFTYVKYGSQVAFGIPGILMAIATLIFWMGRKYYVHVPPTGANPNSFTRVLWSGVKNAKPGTGFWLAAGKDHPEHAVDGAKAVLGVFSLFGWVSVFWALFDQSGSTWTLQAQKMDLNFLGMEINEAQIQAINPILVLVLIPIFSNYIYPTIERLGMTITPLRKMGVGMFVAAASFVAIGFIQHFLDTGVKLSVAWQFVPYFIITVAEVLISITGLEFAYTQAPRAMKSTIMSLWLLTVFFGNIITAYFARINKFPEGSPQFFYFFAFLMAVVGIGFSLVGKFYNSRNFMEEKSQDLDLTSAVEVNSFNMDEHSNKHLIKLNSEEQGSHT
jgi:POT family proton-dependent oligopeptide transporter